MRVIAANLHLIDDEMRDDPVAQRIFLDLDRQVGECQLHRRAISRRACVARLGQEVRIDTAENRCGLLVGQR